MTEVVPENEMKRRRAVMHCAEVAGDAVSAAFRAIRAMHDAGLSSIEINDLVFAHIEDSDQQVVEPIKHTLPLVYETLFGEGRTATIQDPDPMMAMMNSAVRIISERESREKLMMETVLLRLFAEAPKLENARGQPVEGQAPALPEIAVMMRSGHAMQGALSTTPEGGLRLMSPKQLGARRVMVEHFFDYADIEAVAIVREIAASAGSVIVGAT